MKKYFQFFVILQTLLLTQSHGQVRRLLRRGSHRQRAKDESIHRAASGFPVNFLEENDPIPPVSNNAHPDDHTDVDPSHPFEEYFQHNRKPELRQEPVGETFPSQGLFGDDQGIGEEAGSIAADFETFGVDPNGLGGMTPEEVQVSIKQQEANPLNFLNLAGTDFQPGRMVNIFFGLMIMIFMIVIHGYILWIAGIAYLPGTRALHDSGWSWEIDPDSTFQLLDIVLDAIEYWAYEQTETAKDNLHDFR